MAHLAQLLYATLDANPSVRAQGEAGLASGAMQPGFGLALAQVCTSPEYAYGIRQLAGLVLRKYVKEHWQAGDKTFVAPQTSDEEKAAIRRTLPVGLADAQGKIRTACALAIAAVAALDWPEQWPELTGTLVTAVMERRSREAVSGAMRCLSLIADDLDEASLPAVVPVLFPALLSVVQDTTAGPSILRRALQVLHACLLSIAYMPAAAAGRMRPLVLPHVPTWLIICAALLERPLAPADAQQCGVQMEALKVAQRLLANFPVLGKDAPLSGETQRTLAAVWGLLTRAHEAYIPHCVDADDQGDEDGPAVDSDGDELSFQMLVTQLLETMLMMTGSARYGKVLEPGVQQLMLLLLGFLRCTGSQAARWSADAREFVADQEEDFASVRAVCEMLLDELLSAMPVAAAPGLSAAVQACLALPQMPLQQQHGRLGGWWKAREAALLAVGSTAEVFLEPGTELSSPPPYRHIIDSILHTELNPAAAAAAGLPPLLIARALWTCGRLAPAVDASTQLGPLLDALASALAPGAHPLLRVTAARCCASVFGRGRVDAAAQVIGPRAPALMSLLTGLVAAQSESEDALDGALDALAQLAAAQPACAAAGAALLGPPLLNAWASVFNDPQLSDSVTCLVAALVAASLASCEAIHSAALPQLRAVFLEAQSSSPPPGLLAAALDLTLAAVRHHAGGENVCRSAHGALLGPVMTLTKQSSDSAIVSGGVNVLCALLRAAGERLPVWGIDGAGGGGDATQALLDVAASVLSRGGADADCAPHAGPLLVALLRSQPVACGPLLPGITSAVAQRLAASTQESGGDVAALPPPGAGPLVRVFAMLALLDAGRLVDMLAAHNDPAMWGDGGSALGAVLRAWTSIQPEIQGAAAIAQSTAGLAALACCGHPALEGVLLRGDRVDDTPAAGAPLIRTRSRARATGPERYTLVPAPRVLLALCADALLEEQEARAMRGADEEDEWSTDEDDDDGDDDGDGGDRNGLLDIVDQKLDALAEAGEAAWESSFGPRDPSDESHNEPLCAPGAVAQFIGAQLRHAAGDPVRGAAIIAHGRSLSTARQQALEASMRAA